ncbi:LLM class flavin-dependent oxidoreductase [Rhodococcoides corynebacterioides]|uniref:LLM class flavin-dependent oxidoreductase n=1 Tax=Rhodococcoides corynebacterioides TaxID=53972 RepID=UPI001C9B7907|nr:LLM class flavin-dependent oxidoreductase [Rhodococcus corynebacterioides]MBY6351479.1 LLM class flavin-dependent oxidoreductase [Rhodococcus corynebacterioides]
MTTPFIGTVFTPAHDPTRLPAAVRAAEAAELDEFWLWEDCFSHGGLTTAAVALASTTRIRVGLGLMPAPLRSVALTAMEVASLHRLFPGRFVPGVGHGVQRWMEQVGSRAASPMTLLDEYHAALRALLAGDEVTVDGRYVRLNAVRLQYPVPGAPLMVGGEGPRTVRFAAARSDGTLLSAALTDDRLRAACAEVRDAASTDDHPIVAPRLVAVGPGAADRLRAEAARWGRDSADDIAVAGGPEEIAAEFTRLGEMGITSVLAHPTDDEPDLEGWTAVIGEAAALLR